MREEFDHVMTRAGDVLRSPPWVVPVGLPDSLIRLPDHPMAVLGQRTTL
jgi:hypothetical protein